MDKIVIVEDDPSVRQELCRLLSNAGYEVAALEEFTNTAGEVLRLEPDLVLLDMKLPVEDGLSVCDRIRRESDVAVMFVTSANTSMDELNCIMRGGDDYISKPYEAPILLARIGALLRRAGKARRENGRITHKGIVLDTAAASLCLDGKSVELTKNELKIIYLLFRSPGRVVSRTELLDYLWENEAFIDDNSLSVHVTRLRGKLAQLGAPDLIGTRRGLGYIV